MPSSPSLTDLTKGLPPPRSAMKEGDRSTGGESVLESLEGDQLMEAETLLQQRRR